MHVLYARYKSFVENKSYYELHKNNKFLTDNSMDFLSEIYLFSVGHKFYYFLTKFLAHLQNMYILLCKFFQIFLKQKSTIFKKFKKTAAVCPRAKTLLSPFFVYSNAGGASAGRVFVHPV